jgi:hypothetical protein
MTSTKAEVDKRLTEITQDILSASDQDTVSSARSANRKPIERINAGATEAQPKARTPETGANGDYPGGNGDDDFPFQMAAETI